MNRNVSARFKLIADISQKGKRVPDRGRHAAIGNRER